MQEPLYSIFEQGEMELFKSFWIPAFAGMTFGNITQIVK